MEITRSFGCSYVCYSLMTETFLIIQSMKHIVAFVFLLANCRVVSGLPDEDIMKDASLSKREC
jgi:hypothetical protein